MVPATLTASVAVSVCLSLICPSCCLIFGCLSREIVAATLTANFVQNHANSANEMDGQLFTLKKN